MGLQQLALGALLLTTTAIAGPIDVIRRQAKTAVSEDFYNDLLRYGTYARAASTDPCPSPPDGSVVLNYIMNNLTDTQATLFRSDSTQEIILAFPGTASVEDFLTDFSFLPVPYNNCAGCKVHAGFYAAWTSVSQDSKDALNAAVKANSDYSITVVGYSLGAAIANLAYAGLADSGDYPQIGATWTYGEPRVGNPTYADFIDSLSGATDTNAGIYQRVTHYNDGIPQLPPQSFGFQHSRTEYWASLQNDTAATTFMCVGQEPADCNDGAGGVGFTPAHTSYPGVDSGYSCTG